MGPRRETLREIGQALALSHEGVRLIEVKALRRLRRRLVLMGAEAG
jgi:DNA-directed RNA polymerase sigma subunit (sigma70/sigma32)